MSGQRLQTVRVILLLLCSCSHTCLAAFLCCLPFASSAFVAGLIEGCCQKWSVARDSRKQPTYLSDMCHMGFCFIHLHLSGVPFDISLRMATADESPTVGSMQPSAQLAPCCILWCTACLTATLLLAGSRSAAWQKATLSLAFARETVP